MYIHINVYIYTHSTHYTCHITTLCKRFLEENLNLAGPGDLFNGLRLCSAAPGRHGGHLGRSLPRRRQQRSAGPTEESGGSLKDGDSIGTIGIMGIL